MLAAALQTSIAILYGFLARVLDSLGSGNKPQHLQKQEP